MNLGTLLYTWFKGIYVGKDNDGNKYYSKSKNFKSKDAKRWVVFKNEIEASSIPPHWHAWLHKMTDDPPINYKHDYSWQKNHISNQTGTSNAYFPSSHPLSKSSNKYKPKADYETWKPD